MDFATKQIFKVYSFGRLLETSESRLRELRLAKKWRHLSLIEARCQYVCIWTLFAAILKLNEHMMVRIQVILTGLSLRKRDNLGATATTVRQSGRAESGTQLCSAPCPLPVCAMLHHCPNRLQTHSGE